MIEDDFHFPTFKNNEGLPDDIIDFISNVLRQAFAINKETIYSEIQQGIGFGIIHYIYNIICYNLVRYVYQTPKIEDPLLEFLQTNVMAPYYEELYFRAMLPAVLSNAIGYFSDDITFKNMSQHFAILGSSYWFAQSHQGASPTFKILSSSAALLFQKQLYMNHGSVWGNVVAHALHNTTIGVVNRLIYSDKPAVNTNDKKAKKNSTRHLNFFPASNNDVIKTVSDDNMRLSAFGRGSFTARGCVNN